MQCLLFFVMYFTKILYQWRLTAYSRHAWSLQRSSTNGGLLHIQGMLCLYKDTLPMEAYCIFKACLVFTKILYQWRLTAFSRHAGSLQRYSTNGGLLHIQGMLGLYKDPLPMEAYSIFKACLVFTKTLYQWRLTAYSRHAWSLQRFSTNGGLLHIQGMLGLYKGSLPMAAYCIFKACLVFTKNLYQWRLTAYSRHAWSLQRSSTNGGLLHIQGMLGLYKDPLPMEAYCIFKACWVFTKILYQWRLTAYSRHAWSLQRSSTNGGLLHIQGMLGLYKDPLPIEANCIFKACLVFTKILYQWRLTAYSRHAWSLQRSSTNGGLRIFKACLVFTKILYQWRFTAYSRHAWSLQRSSTNGGLQHIQGMLGLFKDPLAMEAYCIFKAGLVFTKTLYQWRLTAYSRHAWSLQISSTNGGLLHIQGRLGLYKDTLPMEAYSIFKACLVFTKILYQWRPTAYSRQAWSLQRHSTNGGLQHIQGMLGLYKDPLPMEAYCIFKAGLVFTKTLYQWRPTAYSRQAWSLQRHSTNGGLLHIQGMLGLYKDTLPMEAYCIFKACLVFTKTLYQWRFTAYSRHAWSLQRSSTNGGRLHIQGRLGLYKDTLPMEVYCIFKACWVFTKILYQWRLTAYSRHAWSLQRSSTNGGLLNIQGRLGLYKDTLPMEVYCIFKACWVFTKILYQWRLTAYSRHTWSLQRSSTNGGLLHIQGRLGLYKDTLPMEVFLHIQGMLGLYKDTLPMEAYSIFKACLVFTKILYQWRPTAYSRHAGSLQRYSTNGGLLHIQGMLGLYKDTLPMEAYSIFKACLVFTKTLYQWRPTAYSRHAWSLQRHSTNGGLLHIQGMLGLYKDTLPMEAYCIFKACWVFTKILYQWRLTAYSRHAGSLQRYSTNGGLLHIQGMLGLYKDTLPMEVYCIFKTCWVFTKILYQWRTTAYSRHAGSLQRYSTNGGSLHIQGMLGLYKDPLPMEAYCIFKAGLVFTKTLYQWRPTAYSRQAWFLQRHSTNGGLLHIQGMLGLYKDTLPMEANCIFKACWVFTKILYQWRPTAYSRHAWSLQRHSTNGGLLHIQGRLGLYKDTLPMEVYCIFKACWVFTKILYQWRPTAYSRHAGSLQRYSTNGGLLHIQGLLGLYKDPLPMEAYCIFKAGLVFTKTLYQWRPTAYSRQAWSLQRHSTNGGLLHIQGMLGLYKDTLPMEAYCIFKACWVFTKILYQWRLTAYSRQAWSLQRHSTNGGLLHIQGMLGLYKDTLPMEAYCIFKAGLVFTKTLYQWRFTAYSRHAGSLQRYSTNGGLLHIQGMLGIYKDTLPMEAYCIFKAC